MTGRVEQHEAPLTKLDRYGVSSLDNSELIALLLGSSRTGLNHSREIIEHFGALTTIAAATVDEIAGMPGIGRAKAARFCAAFELSSRLSREQVQRNPLDSPERIYECFGPQLGHLPQERVIVATVDARLRHLSTTLISVGSVNESTAHPREILRPVITRAAHGFVLIHNHPSGDPSPSQADHQTTKRVADVAGIMQVRFIDHIVVGRPSPGRTPYFSFREAGLVG